MLVVSRVRGALGVAAVAALLVALPGGAGAADGETPPTPAATSPEATPLTIELDPMGDVASYRLAKARRVPVSLKTSGAAQVRVELLVSRSVARALKVRVPAGAASVSIAHQRVSATGPGYLVANPAIPKATARRLAAKPRAFTLLVTATAGTVWASTTLTVQKHD